MTEELLFRITFASHHQATSSTRHFGNLDKGGWGLQPMPAGLQIWRLGADIYLYYLNADGAVANDTWHDCLDRAFEQAEFEFGVARREWEHVRD